MSAPLTRPVQARAGQLARLWCLRQGGCGNGLADSSWVPVLQVSARVVPSLLGALCDAGVPGCAAPAGLATGRLRDRSGRPATWQLWVGASGYGRAESALLAVMPSIAREAAS